MQIPWVNAVSPDEVRQLDQKLPEPGIFLKQRVGFVGTFVTIRGSIPLQGISKQRKTSWVIPHRE